MYEVNQCSLFGEVFLKLGRVDIEQRLYGLHQINEGYYNQAMCL